MHDKLRMNNCIAHLLGTDNRVTNELEGVNCSRALRLSRSRLCGGLSADHVGGNEARDNE